MGDIWIGGYGGALTGDQHEKWRSGLGFFSSPRTAISGMRKRYLSRSELIT